MRWQPGTRWRYAGANYSMSNCPPPMSQVILKTPAQLDLMRRAGQLLAKVFADLDGFIRPGVTTMQINDRAEAFIVDTLKARPASKGQYGFLIRSIPRWTMWCAMACPMPMKY